MSTSTIQRTDTSTIQRTHAPTAHAESGLVPDEVIDNLDVHIAGPDEYESLSQLAERLGARRPPGALMVGSVDGRPLAAASMASGEAIEEPTPAGAAAAAVVRYTVARVSRRRGGRGRNRAPIAA